MEFNAMDPDWRNYLSPEEKENCDDLIDDIIDNEDFDIN